MASVAAWIAVVQNHKPALWYMIDLHVFDWGGDQVLHHQSKLYDGRFENWLPFLYPPFAALVFAALDRLFTTNSIMLIETMSVLVSVFGTVWLTLGMAARDASAPAPAAPTGRLPRRRPRLSRAGLSRLGPTLALGAFALWLEPVQQTLYFGQVSALLMFLVVADIALPERFRGKGILIGIAAGVKLTPGLFILYLLLTRRFRAAAVAAASFLGTVAIGVALLPRQAKEFWSPGGLISSANRVGVSYLQNQSFNGFLNRIMSPDSAHHVWQVLAVLAGLAGMILAALLHRRAGDLAGLLVTAVVALMVSPISWSHYWVWVIPALTWGVHAAWKHRSWWTASAMAVGYLVFFAYPLRVADDGIWRAKNELLPMGLLWSMPRASNRELVWNAGETVVGNLYVAIGVLALVVPAVWLVWTWRAARRGAVADGPFGSAAAAAVAAAVVAGEESVSVR